MKGLVIKSTGNWYSVLMDSGKTWNCRMKGRLRIDGYKSTNPIAVGDRVEAEEEADGNGVISQVEPRRNCIIRKSKNLSKQTHILAANVDQALLVVTMEAPRTSFGFIDRFLATAEAYRIPAILVFNKYDLFGSHPELAEDIGKTMEAYRRIGYHCVCLSSVKMSADDRRTILEILGNKITLVAGHSGSGKSTFINAIESGLNLRTGEISDVHFKGMHTTTFTEMHALSGGGFIIDTPGIQEFSVINMEKSEIDHFFPEIFRKSSGCKYGTCLHVTEPKCAVLEAVESGEIAATRYHSYVSILNGEEVIKEYDD